MLQENQLIPTPHIKAAKEDISSVVIMPGDPLRAKFIAENFLQDVKLVNTVRNMLMYTGTYQGKKITVAGSGMGMASIGIYSYELFKFYEVDCIIRIGSAGSYQKDVNVYDVINVSQSYSESTYAKYSANINEEIIKSSSDIHEFINECEEKLNIFKATKHKFITGQIHSSDVFYRFHDWKQDEKIKQCLAVEMESFALFANAKILNKSAACLLTISDSLVTGESISADLREISFKNMMKIALEAAINFKSGKK